VGQIHGSGFDFPQSGIANDAPPKHRNLKELQPHAADPVHTVAIQSNRDKPIRGASDNIMKPFFLSILSFMAIASIGRAAGPADLIRLYEDEILAHDLYVALGKIHPEVMPLQNIPFSEMRHREAMASILKTEGIVLPKPAKGGRFVSEGLDEIFAKWLAEGAKSEADACRVGVRLEDHDIAELRQAQTDFPKHREVLGQLEAASNNHLRAFHRNLTARGGNYTPEALTKADFKAILDDKGKGAGGCNAAGDSPGGGCGKGSCGKGRRNGSGGGQGNGKGWRGGR
jgi:hypothetical protein